MYLYPAQYQYLDEQAREGHYSKVSLHIFFQAKFLCQFRLQNRLERCSHELENGHVTFHTEPVRV